MCFALFPGAGRYIWILFFLENTVYWISELTYRHTISFALSTQTCTSDYSTYPSVTNWQRP